MDTDSNTARPSSRKRRKKPKNQVIAAIRAATNPPPAETMATFLFLAEYADWVTGRNIYVAKATIAVMLGKSMRMIQSYLKTLRDGKWIEAHEPDNLEQFMRKFPRADQRPTCYRIVLETLALKPTRSDPSLPVGGPIYWNGERWSVCTGSDGLYVRGAMHRSQPPLLSSRVPPSSPSVPSEAEGEEARSATTPPHREAGGGEPEQVRPDLDSVRREEDREIEIYARKVTHAALTFLGEADITDHAIACQDLIHDLFTGTTGPLVRTAQDILLIAARISFITGEDPARYDTDENEKPKFREPLALDSDFRWSLKPANYPGCRRRSQKWRNDFEHSNTISLYTKAHNVLLKNLTGALRRAGLRDALLALEDEGLITVPDDYVRTESNGGALT